MQFFKNRAIFISAMLSIVYFFMLPKSIYKSLPMGDTPIFEYFGYAMTRGEILFVDLFDHKGPFIFIFHYLGFLLNGENGVKIIFTVFIYLFLYFSYRISNIFSNEYVAILNTIIIFFMYSNFSEFGLNVETLALPFITYSLYIYVKYFEKFVINKIEIILIGMSFTIVFFTRANMIGVWFVFSILFLILNFKESKLQIFNYIFYFIIGILVVLTPLFIYLIYNDALYEMFYQSFYINLLYASGNGIGLEGITYWLIEHFKIVPIIVVIVAANLVYKENKKSFIYNLVTISIILLAILSKRDYEHYLIVIIPLLLPYLSILTSEIFRSLNKDIYKYVVLFAGITILFNTSILTVYNGIVNRDKVNEDFKIVSEHIKNNTKEDERIYTHRLSGSIYLQSERMASTRYFFLPAIRNELYSVEFTQEINRELPKYIVISDKFIGKGIQDRVVQDLAKEKYTLEKKVNSFNIYKLN